MFYGNSIVMGAGLLGSIPSLGSAIGCSGYSKGKTWSHDSWVLFPSLGQEWGQVGYSWEAWREGCWVVVSILGGEWGLMVSAGGDWSSDFWV